MENKNLIQKIKDLMVTYGFLNEEVETPEYQSFKLEDNTLIQVVGAIELDKEIFFINEATGEREILSNGTYKTEELVFTTEEGKVTVVNNRFAEVKTVDGVVLKVDGDVAVGNAVLVVTEDGEIPAPDGEYELEDGKKFKVEGGLISEIEMEEPAPEETPAPEEVAPAEAPVMGEEMTALFDMFKTFINSVTEKMNVIESKMNKLDSEFNSFKKEPAGTKIPNGKTEFSVELEDDKLSRILKLRNK